MNSKDYSSRSGSNHYNYKHGLCKDPLFYVWNAMIRRCCNPKCSAYSRYGAIGRTVCEEWRDDAHKFIEWAYSNGYKKGLTLDRIENSKGYSPDNCRWVDRFVQQNNTRRNHYIVARGETHSIAEWSRITGINKNTITKRLRSGWSEESALTKPVDKTKIHERHKKN